MTRVFAIMLAGGLGALARYGLTLFIQSQLVSRIGKSGWATFLGPTFPLSTLVINVLGSLLLAFLATLVFHRALSPEWQWIAGTGFLGAFTTWSTFSVEAETLIHRGEWKAAGFYILGSFILSLLAVVAGRALAMRFIPAA